MVTPLVTSLLHFHQFKLFKTWFVFWHYLSCFGYFSKNWAIFSKSSGHPGSLVQGAMVLTVSLFLFCNFCDAIVFSIIVQSAERKIHLDQLLRVILKGTFNEGAISTAHYGTEQSGLWVRSGLDDSKAVLSFSRYVS
jgi:hypothetical protein